MIVRELVTLLRYQEDKAGMNSYVAGLQRLAALAASLFSIKIIMDTADAWATVETRVGLVSKSVAEQEQALESLYELSQRTGQSYTETASLFATIGRNSKELGLDLQQELDLTETINKAMVIGGGSREASQAALIQLGQALSSGVLRGDELRSILEQAPRLAQAIADSLEIPVGKLREMGTEGKLTSKAVAEGLLKQLPVLRAEFEKMSLTFGRAFTTVQNRFGKFISDIGKATGLWVTMADAIVTTSEYIFNHIERLRDIVGGYGNALRLAGIVAVALFGPRMLAMVGRMVAMLWGLVTVTAALRGAWFLVSAAILVAFEDIYGWWVGKDSITGRIFGRREEWQATIDAWKDYFLNILNQITDAINRVGTALRLPGYHEKSLEKSLGDPGSPAEDDRLEKVRQYDATHDWRGMPIAPPASPPPVPMDAPAARPVPMDAPPPSSRDESSIRGDLEQIGQWFGKQWQALAEPPTRMPLVPSLGPMFDPQIPLGSLVPPAALAPPNVTNTTNNDVRAPISVTVNSASDTPQAIGAAAGEGARKGALEGWARTLGLAAPQTEYGLAY